MQMDAKRDILLVTAGDRIVCPYCATKLPLRLLPSTRAADLPVYCKRCKKTSIVNIEPEPESLSR